MSKDSTSTDVHVRFFCAHATPLSSHIHSILGSMSNSNSLPYSIVVTSTVNARIHIFEQPPTNSTSSQSKPLSSSIGNAVKKPIGWKVGALKPIAVASVPNAGLNNDQNYFEVVVCNLLDPHQFEAIKIYLNTHFKPKDSHQKYGMLIADKTVPAGKTKATNASNTPVDKTEAENLAKLVTFPFCILDSTPESVESFKSAFLSHLSSFIKSPAPPLSPLASPTSPTASSASSSPNIYNNNNNNTSSSSPCTSNRRSTANPGPSSGSSIGSTVSASSSSLPPSSSNNSSSTSTWTKATSHKEYKRTTIHSTSSSSSPASFLHRSFPQEIPALASWKDDDNNKTANASLPALYRTSSSTRLMICLNPNLMESHLKHFRLF